MDTYNLVKYLRRPQEMLVKNINDYHSLLWLPNIWYLLLFAWKIYTHLLDIFLWNEIPKFHILIHLAEILEFLHIATLDLENYELIKQGNEWYVPHQYYLYTEQWYEDESWKGCEWVKCSLTRPSSYYEEGMSSSLLSMISSYKLWRYFLFHGPSCIHVK